MFFVPPHGCCYLQDRGKYTYANGDEFMGLWDKGIKLSGTFYYMVWEPRELGMSCEWNDVGMILMFLVDVFGSSRTHLLSRDKWKFTNVYKAKY